VNFEEPFLCVLGRMTLSTQFYYRQILWFNIENLKLDPSIYESIQKEKVMLGDVIYIEANTGAVKVLT
jgi:hypothetical protein